MSKSEGGAIPLDLSRSLIVIIIPGAVALTPLGLWLTALYPSLIAFYEAHQATSNVVVFVSSVLAGLVIENIMTWLEVRWDREREKTYEVAENWYKYLARVTEHEPAGYGYLRRMWTTLYFELAMLVAAPVLLIGLAIVLRWEPAPFNNCLARIALALLGIASGCFFYSAAKDSHGVLCKTRMEINTRLDARETSETAP
jgi:hypothetical protein